MEIKRVCVFCGSREGLDTVYVEMARALGRHLAEHQMGLVYGGASVGLMGAIADQVLACGGHVTGVIPESLAQKEIKHSGAQEMFVVDSMHTRKAKMASLSDAFVAMPGGYGTLEEFFEVVTWAQLGIHRKPIGLLNIKGYYDALLRMMDHMVKEGFLPEEYRVLFVDATEPVHLFEQLEALEMPESILRWMGIEQS